MLSALLGWWLVSRLELVPSLFLPSPASVWTAFVDFAFGDGYRGHTLFEHLGVSLWRITVGFLGAAATAIPLGLLAGRWRSVRAVTEPVVDFYRPLPPLGYYAVLIVWFGLGELSKVALLFLAAFPPIYIAALEGVRGTREVWRDAALTLGARPGQVFHHVVLRSALPSIFDGLRVAVLNAYAALVAAELVNAKIGIGASVLQAARFLLIPTIFVGIIAMGITGILLDSTIKAVDRRVNPWRGKG